MKFHLVIESETSLWIRWMVFLDTYFMCSSLMFNSWVIDSSFLKRPETKNSQTQRWVGQKFHSDDSLTRWHIHNSDLSFLASYSKHVAGQGVTQTIRWLFWDSTVFENHRKSLVQHCERGECYVYILSGQKLIKNAQNGPFCRVFANLKLAVKQCYQTGQF